MSSADNNLSKTQGSDVPDASGYKVGIVWAEWNSEITLPMKDAAYKTLVAHGISNDDVIVKAVPGSFELTLGAQWMAENTDVDAVICIGCVIQGETRHFDFICNAVANGLTQLNIEHSMPFIFGVLTPDNMQQALDRAGGRYGNKGDEAAITAIKMLALEDSF
jgi:6,7-dimethyl-8-ribityllumazine synthase